MPDEIKQLKDEEQKDWVLDAVENHDELKKQSPRPPQPSKTENLGCLGDFLLFGGGEFIAEVGCGCLGELIFGVFTTIMFLGIWL